MINDFTQAQIEGALGQYIEADLGIDLLTAKAIKGISIAKECYSVDLTFGFPVADIEASISAHCAKILGQAPKSVTISRDICSHRVQTGLQSLPQVKNIIAVASGKGGVGKSTTAVNLALALAHMGAKVGILDADIYGPSQPQMLGTYEKPVAEGQKVQPIERYGIQSMSIGYLVDQKSAMVWRGPMVSGALQQLIRDTQWNDLDYLIIDLPPGTGDIQLTLAQKVPVSAALIVTTPQDLALLDARRAIAMFEKVSVPVLGVVENMSVHVCSNCGHESHLFGQGGAAKIADEYHISVLGEIPLDISIREQADNGKPTVAAAPESGCGQAYIHMARRMAAQLSLRARDYSSKFPNIVIEK